MSHRLCSFEDSLAVFQRDRDGCWLGQTQMLKSCCPYSSHHAVKKVTRLCGPGKGSCWYALPQ
eukprot:4031636-Amphidinium_carterae.1